MLAELARVLKMQRGGRAEVKSLEGRLAERGWLEQAELDRLAAAEFNQRQVQRNLTSRDEGVPMHVLLLLADLENNRIDSLELQQRMRDVLAETDRLGRTQLPEIGRDLTAAVKSAEIRLQEPTNPAVGRDAATAASLSGAGKGQDQVIAALEAMLGRLNRWDGYRRFHRELSQLLRDQEELARQAAELGRRTLASDLRDLPPEEAADLKVFADRQVDLAGRLDRIEQDMEAVGYELKQSDAAAAENLAAALEESRRTAIAAQMRRRAGTFQENQSRSGGRPARADSSGPSAVA